MGGIKETRDLRDRGLWAIPQLLPTQAEDAESSTNESPVSIEVADFRSGMVVEPFPVGFDNQALPAPEEINLEGPLANLK